MYEWLTDALQNSAQIVTANRRLARVLTEEFSKQQIAAGRTVWRSPSIRSLQDWLAERLDSAELARQVPIRINTHQSRVLWERCLRREITDPLLNIAMLVRQSRESWTRLHDFGVPLGESESAALGKDQKIFSQAARNYQSILDRECWIDDAGLTGLLTELIEDGQMSLPTRMTLGGFDRIVPAARSLFDAVRAAGVQVTEVGMPVTDHDGVIYSYENSDSEMRAAGAWASRQLHESPEQNIAVVVTHLELDAERCARLIREGLTPGWQTAGLRHKAAVNVSYGRKLGSYPVIAVALLALRWLQADLGSRDVSTLLRSSALATQVGGGRCRLEIALRNLPDRNWSPSMILGQLEDRDSADDAKDWLARIRVLENSCAKLPRRATPSEWVVLIDDVLAQINWPGTGSLDSVEFQLINRWKEVLNDLARLELVASTMTFSEMLSRLLTMSKETVFQPESDGAIVQVLGPLEAAGMQFDKLWITGLSATNWPPSGRPSLLISRNIQRDYAMPDANPEDTLEYARRVLQRLISSAQQFVCSYPLTEGDAEQSESGLLADTAAKAASAPTDPGWHACRLASTCTTKLIHADPVPEVAGSESISGGAATIQRQLVEPFSAFAFGRLGIRSLPPIKSGLAANLRGTLIHDALHNLYSELPAKADIQAWSAEELQQRISAASDKAFWSHQRHADRVLKKLFELEQQRVVHLLRLVVELDRKREDFSIVQVEDSLDAVIEDVRLRLRVDRIDQLENGGIVILDYKTGQHRQFLGGDGEPREMQLVVYAKAVRGSVDGLGLVNVDSRSVDIAGAGRLLTPDLDWDDKLSQWKGEVESAAGSLQRGDVRVDRLQTTQAARTFALLSRIGELHRDA